MQSRNAKVVQQMCATTLKVKTTGNYSVTQTQYINTVVTYIVTVPFPFQPIASFPAGS